jgi:hypothetical protein
MKLYDSNGNRIYGTGDIVRVKFGTKGSQRAELVSGRKTDSRGHQYYKGCKFSEKSKRWTNPVKIFACEIIGE